MNTALLAKGLFIAGTVPFILLGTLHWIYTFMDMKTPRKLAPRDDAVRIGMQATTLRLTDQTTMWKAWLGFNHSHSIGAITFGLIFLILAVQDFGALVENTMLMRVATVVPLIYVWVGKRFWFSIPLAGVSISAACFVAAFLLTL
ncbi:MAG: hypothetical protein JNK21_16735 [Rhodospirillaceae bacterium]|nr:hypothetical protein [Rhodospirillaceae bacterium]